MSQEIVGIGATAVNGLLDQWSCALYIARRRGLVAEAFQHGPLWSAGMEF